MAKQIAVEARGATKIFGTGDDAVRALDDVSVAIRENEFLCDRPACRRRSG